MLFLTFLLIAYEFFQFGRRTTDRVGKVALFAFSVTFATCAIGHAMQACTFLAAPYRLITAWNCVTAGLSFVVAGWSPFLINRMAYVGRKKELDSHR